MEPGVTKHQTNGVGEIPSNYEEAVEMKDFPDKSSKYEVQPNLTKSIGRFTVLLDTLNKFSTQHRAHIRTLIYGTIFVLYLSYVGYSLYHHFGDEGSWRLLIGTIVGTALIGWNLFVKLKIYKQLVLSCKQIVLPTKAVRVIRWILYVAMVIFLCVYIGITVLSKRPQNLISGTGIVVLILLLTVFSTNRSKIHWHTVFWGLSLQLVFGIVILETSWGKEVVLYLSQRFIELNKHADSGSAYVFTEKYADFPFVFKNMPKVLVFCTILSVLNYLGVMRFIVKNIGGFLGFCLNSAPVESVAAAANIFLGTVESAVLVQEYLADLSDSEFFCMWVTGLSSVGGVAMIVFSGFGIPTEYLLAANVMSAPAALAAAKLSMPDIDRDKNVKKLDLNKRSKAHNILDAISLGTVTGLHLVTAIIVNVIVFISLLDLINTTLTWFGQRAGVENLTVQVICSYVLWPLAYIMGTDSSDCLRVAGLLGLRAVTDPGIAYMKLGEYFENKVSFNNYQALYNDSITQDSNIYLPQWNTTLTSGILTDQSEMIVSYALCGGVCIQNLGIGMGALTALIPSRRMDLINMAPRAFFTASAASFFTASVAGLLYMG